MSSVSTETIPGYVTGAWTLDPTHSDVSFMVRHMMVSKVRGHFRTFEATFTTAADPLQSMLSATVDLTTIETNNEDRDNHIRSADFFDVENNKTLTYTSTGIRAVGGDFVIDGDLSLHGVTKFVPLKLEINGFGPDAFGGIRSGFTATGTINRRDFGIEFNLPLDGGGVVIGDKVQLLIEAEAALNPAES